MTDVAQYSHDNMPMAEIMAEIRATISREAQARYDAERTVAKRELLILRPEARVDLLLQEATPDIVVEPAPKPKHVSAKELTSSLEAEVFRAKLQETFGISDADALEDLIRKVLRQELGSIY